MTFRLVQYALALQSSFDPGATQGGPLALEQLIPANPLLRMSVGSLTRTVALGPSYIACGGMSQFTLTHYLAGAESNATISLELDTTMAMYRTVDGTWLPPAVTDHSQVNMEGLTADRLLVCSVSSLGEDVLFAPVGSMVDSVLRVCLAKAAQDDLSGAPPDPDPSIAANAFLRISFAPPSALAQIPVGRMRGSGGALMETPLSFSRRQGVTFNPSTSFVDIGFAYDQTQPVRDFPQWGRAAAETGQSRQVLAMNRYAVSLGLYSWTAPRFLGVVGGILGPLITQVAALGAQLSPAGGGHGTTVPLYFSWCPDTLNAATTVSVLWDISLQ